MRSPQHVAEEIRAAKSYFPQVREFFFDDDTLTDNLPRAEEIARELGKLGVTWSCNAKANVPRKTLEVLKDNGLRLLLVGYESGNQQILFNIKKGMRVEFARRFTRDCHELGIVIHCFTGTPDDAAAYAPQNTPWLQGNDYLQMLTDEFERLQREQEEQPGWQISQQMEVTQDEMRQVVAQMDAIVQQRQAQRPH